MPKRYELQLEYLQSRRALTLEELELLLTKGWEGSAWRDRNRALVVVMAMHGDRVSEVLKWVLGDFIKANNTDTSKIEFRASLTMHAANRKGSGHTLKHKEGQSSAEEAEEPLPKRHKPSPDDPVG